MGAGRTELAQVLFGINAADSGSIVSSADIALVPEDRQTQGSILPFSVAANIALPNLATLAPRGWCRSHDEAQLARQWIERLAIKAHGPEQPVHNLSGGNQQKVVIAKWLARRPGVLILDEPTKGIDVGAKAAVHAVTSEFARDGGGVLMISSDLPEILGMSDRVLVMRRGRLRGEFTRAQATSENPAARRERRMSGSRLSGNAPRSGICGAHAGAVPGRDVRVPRFRGAAQSGRAARRHGDPHHAGARPDAGHPRARHRPVDRGESRAVRHAGGGLRSSLARHAAWRRCSSLTLVSGALLGAFNGLLVWKLRLPPIVVTLGTMSIYRGAIYLLSKGAWVNENEMSRGFLAFPRIEFLGLTLLSWLALVVAAAVRDRACAARAWRAISTRLAATPRRQTTPASMRAACSSSRTRSAARIAGVCGYLWVARFAVAYTDIALGFELSVIAACLIGGVAIAGGVGSAVGVVLGCLFIGIIRSSLPLVGISAFWQMFINGVVILVAVLLSARQREFKRTILEVRSMKHAILLRWESMLAAGAGARVHRVLGASRRIS